MKVLAVLLVVCGLASSVFGSVAKPTCGGTTSSKTIQLLTPTNPPRECVYHIKSYSSHVCQLRIDFAMTLAQPTIPTAANGLSYVECTEDYLEVNGMKLCGVEEHQHIYVAFNTSAGVSNVDLRFVLANRAGAFGLPKPEWDMTVTQLECPTGAALRSIDDASAVPVGAEARATLKDGFLLAPADCLQYFPQTSGIITSFNFNNGAGIYPGQLNYAICFRRTTKTSALELDVFHFKLGAETRYMRALEMDNFCYPQLRTEGSSEDYLMIPQGSVVDTGVRATYFCGDSAQASTIRSAHPGPLMMIFNSDGVYKAGREAGFGISYKVL